MEDKLNQLKQHLARCIDLNYAAAVLSWDQETYMPPDGAQSRADQLATLQSLSHQYFTDPQVGALLEDLTPYADSLPYDSDAASLIRVTKRDYDKRIRIPADLVGELARASSLGKKAWREARTRNEFAHFEPYLEKLIDLRRRWAACFDAYDNPYDALLDWFEPGMTYQGIAEVFADLKPRLVELVSAITQHKDAVDVSILKVHLPEDRQIAFSREVTEALGYDYQRGRLDLSAHPFTTRFSMWDVRITTRLMPDNPMKAIMSSIHEAGHAMHGQAIRPELYRTGLDVGPMQAVSESQSRFFENVIGRSLPFWQAMYPRFQRAFAPHFDRVPVEAFYRAINHVEPGLIRVEADEVTYGLHIMLRLELENALINGQIATADLPHEWNDWMESYLGVRPPTDSDGVMQDIHWSQGMIGYFPDYLLGSMFSVQLWEAMRTNIPDVEAQVARGEFHEALAWQQEHIMQHGRKFTLPELAERATHMPLSSEPYVRYLHARYGAIYGV